MFVALIVAQLCAVQDSAWLCSLNTRHRLHVLLQEDDGSLFSDGRVFFLQVARDRMFAFDFVTAWLAVGTKHDVSELVCRKGSLDVVDADHSQAKNGVAQQAEAKDDKVACITEDGIDYVEDVYEMGFV